MKISSKTIYGLQFLTRLAMKPNDWSQVKEVVENENISEKYLESIVSRLKNGGLLNVKRGAHGGYKLARHPGEISLGEVISVIEGTELTADLESAPDDMNTIVRQVSVGAIKKLETKLHSLFDAISLDDLSTEAIGRLNDFDFQI